MAELLFPHYNPNDLPAISSVLALLLASAEPPRVDVSRGRSKWLDRPPYPGGRLFIRGRCSARAGDITGYHVWYCCARFGRTVPVREWDISVGSGTPSLYDAPFTEFTCSSGPAGGTNPPHDLNSAGDGWRDAYDTALAALA